MTLTNIFMKAEKVCNSAFFCLGYMFSSLNDSYHLNSQNICHVDLENHKYKTMTVPHLHKYLKIISVTVSSTVSRRNGNRDNLGINSHSSS